MKYKCIIKLVLDIESDEHFENGLAEGLPKPLTKEQRNNVREHIKCAATEFERELQDELHDKQAGWRAKTVITNVRHVKERRG